jgi:hypothetical protein
MIAAVAIRGINKPLDELLISNCAELLGEDVPTPTLWASHVPAKTTMVKKIVRIFFTVSVLVIVGFSALPSKHVRMSCYIRTEGQGLGHV